MEIRFRRAATFINNTPVDGQLKTHIYACANGRKYAGLGACAKDTLSVGHRRLRTTGVGWLQKRKKT